MQTPIIGLTAMYSDWLSCDTMAERGRGGASWYRRAGQSLARLAVNPMIIGVVAGFTVSVLGWKLPDALARTVNLFAMSSSALSLFVIGGTLVGLPMRGMGRRVTPIVLGKLIAHPLAVLLAIFVLPLLGLPVLDPSLRMAAVPLAAMPMPFIRFWPRPTGRRMVVRRHYW